MALPTTAPDLTEAVSPLRVRINREQRLALEWMRSLFPAKYEGVSSVLSEYSLTDVVDAYRRRDDVADA